MESTFELLRWRLLLRRLDSIQSSELHALVIREAHRAAVLASATSFPWLLFPCLFEERVDAALTRHARDAELYWKDLYSPASAAAPA